KTESAPVAEAPLDLVQCGTCHLVQLRENFDLRLLYGDTYGYRSGLNRSMVRHLKEKVRTIERLRDLRTDDLVIDIGSNDGTLLGSSLGRPLTPSHMESVGLKFHRWQQPGRESLPDVVSA